MQLRFDEVLWFLKWSNQLFVWAVFGRLVPMPTDSSSSMTKTQSVFHWPTSQMVEIPIMMAEVVAKHQLLKIMFLDWTYDTCGVLTRCHWCREKWNRVIQMKHFHIVKKFGFCSVKLSIETVLNRFQKYRGKLWSEICTNPRKRKPKIHWLS